jgi:3-methyl-2-oxobutanoate hydroxymethyltransferase
MKKVTINSVKNAKNKQVLTMLTAYDYLFAKLFDGKVDMILVGDSLNMSFNGQKDTLSATLDMMIYHTKAVCNGANSSLVVCDMPFGTYKNKKVALENAIRVYQETSADAIKIEGGKEKANIVKHLTDNSIAVMGHIGLLPQFFRGEGGYKIKGKDEDSAQKLIEDAQAIQEAGAFAIVCEGVRSDVAKQIAQSVNVPIIGIGAGNGVDGQVLVYSDMLGLFEDFRPKFVREYLDGAKLIKNSVDNFVNDVQDRSFPSKEESY